jgi:CHAT domain-containing protein
LAAPGLAGFVARHAATLACAAPVAARIATLPGAQLAECTQRGDTLPYRIYAVQRGRTLYVAQGLRGYDSAVALGLRTLVAERPVDGLVEVAVTDAGDPAAFARTQAGLLDAQSALSEGYVRNNAGSFAEAAEFFGALVENSATRPQGRDTTEYLLNQGLQQSNLGNATLAELAFQQAAARGAASDVVLGRMLRNYRAIHQLSRKHVAAALTILAEPVAALTATTDTALALGTITATLADRLNRDTVRGRQFGAVETRLRPSERAQLLDAQARLLRGVGLRLQHRDVDALAAFDAARRMLAAVRGGKVTSVAFLHAELASQAALAEEARGDFAAGERDLVRALGVLDGAYPQSAAGLMAKARLAGYRTRRGDTAGALALYGAVVRGSGDIPGGIAQLRDQLKPYFDLLAARSGSDPAAASEMFAANQVLVRPGLAQTQAVLARELSAGDDAAAQLFRKALNRSRDLARVAGEVAMLAEADPRADSDAATALAAARARLAEVQRDQVALQAQLAAYPRYRVLDSHGLTLAELQKALKPGEAFYEMRIIDQDVYALLVTPATARGFKIAATAAELGKSVEALRASIVRIDGGVFVTDPFDLARARQLYLTLFGPFGDAMAGIDHLIYEADGPLLQLPANLLVTDQASIDAYAARQKKPGADAFDFTGIAWLGRGRDVTTAVSPRAFTDIRLAAPSRAGLAYLGLGQNAPPPALTSFLAPAPTRAISDPCGWPMEAWSHPISGAELLAARDFLGTRQSTVLLDGAFSDTAIAARADLANYRILHFATHGLVTAPRPECPARPALLTSFGSGASDGLLTFREIYDLRIDADMVILSACDTAGMATLEATRDAGIATGGNFALDGLVRAFVGAGARSVVASHWPVPDQYDATRRLILGMLGAPPGTSIAGAMRRAETALMDDPATSHPYYWAAFAVVGDGARPLAGSH